MSISDGTVHTAAELRARVDAHHSWSHTIDIAPGVTTRGRFDLRPVLNQLPWPNVRGKRCLDIGTGDGFLAFEMERRGAAEVVAVDVDEPCGGWVTGDGERRFQPCGGLQDRGSGFRLAAELIGSRVQWRRCQIADLDPGELGVFDVVLVGTLLHPRDPVRALRGVRRVTAGVVLSSQPIEMWLTVLGRGRPLYALKQAEGEDWFEPNAAGHRQLLEVAGFAVERVSRPYTVPITSGPTAGPSLQERVRSAAVRALTGSWQGGVLHRCLLARPSPTIRSGLTA